MVQVGQQVQVSLVQQDHQDLVALAGLQDLQVLAQQVPLDLRVHQDPLGQVVRPEQA